MTDQERSKLLSEFHKRKERNVGRLMGKTKRFMDMSMEKTWQKNGFHDLRIAHISIMTYIPSDGISMNGLTDTLNISKQAISQIVKELTEIGYLEVKHHPTDKRIKLLFHTSKGEDFLITLLKTSKEIEKKFIKILGKEKYDTLSDILFDLVTNIPHPKLGLNQLGGSYFPSK